jgi:hypothetical protein
VNSQITIPAASTTIVESIELAISRNRLFIPGSLDLPDLTVPELVGNLQWLRSARPFGPVFGYLAARLSLAIAGMQIDMIFAGIFRRFILKGKKRWIAFSLKFFE